MDWRDLSWYSSQSFSWLVTISGGAKNVETDLKPRTVVFDTLFPDAFLPGPNCGICAEQNQSIYDIHSSSSGGVVDTNMVSVDVDLGVVSGEVVKDAIFLSGFVVSYSAYWLKKGTLIGN